MKAHANIVIFETLSKKGIQFFKSEIGGHRFQRIPPTETKGRRQTSTVTVAILDDEINSTISIPAKDISRKTTRGSGKGGQHRNKVETCVVLTHIPTQISVRAEEHRTQAKNEKVAMDRLIAILSKKKFSKQNDRIRKERKSQIGTGMRGDKRRTYQFQHGTVHDHVTGKKCSIKQIQKGKFELLH